jgi:hypothetical protein
MNIVNNALRLPAVASHPIVPVDCLRARVLRYLHEHPQASWQEFLRDAIQNEIARRETSMLATEWGDARWGSRGTSRWTYHRHRLTADDIRIHLWLRERLALLHGKRPSWRRKAGRILAHIPMIRWLFPACVKPASPGLFPHRNRAVPPSVQATCGKGPFCA